jgi:hypothetical protein
MRNVTGRGVAPSLQSDLICGPDQGCARNECVKRIPEGVGVRCKVDAIADGHHPMMGEVVVPDGAGSDHACRQ